MTLENEFDDWYAHFQQAVRKHGWQPDFDEADREWAYDEWQEHHREPGDAASMYAGEMRHIAPQDFKSDADRNEEH